ncbi:hypothetical protein HJG60_010341 [Phyllostomus discolor]|uniref:Uncharacterized protein n=1 Tax=Phyllostomus discolor TaxID=89673 RepID=A0A834EKA3_9CHIR|nr:hypothetical protein HJG60_010341 [Phyllostomus discolor]
MANKYMNRCLPSLVVRETQIKTTRRYHLTPSRMTIINKTRNNKSWRKYGQKGTLTQCLWKCKLVEPLWWIVGRFLKRKKERKKKRIVLPCDSAISLLGIYAKKSFIKIYVALCSLQLYSQQHG